MLFDLSFQVDWKELRKRKREATALNNQRENAKRLHYTFQVNDKVCIEQRHYGLHPKFSQARRGPYRITNIYSNGVAKLQQGPVSQKVHMRYLTPFFER